MRVPIRKGGKYSRNEQDPFLTLEKFNDLKLKLDQLKKKLPKAIAEVKRLSEMGDFSENAAYGLAKGRLRGMNQAILDLERQIKQAQIIKTVRNSSRVQLGNKVTVEVNGKQKEYLILGSVEANPENNIISYNSPIGVALFGRQVGEIVEYLAAGKRVECKIIKIQ